jgi:predicted lipoprotein with Yx(FWY)xxD motif
VVVAVGVAALLAASVSLAAGSERSAARRSNASIRITIRRLSRLGPVLVTGRGMTLYMFVPDKRRRVTCVAACAKIWPPLKLAAGAKVIAAGGVKARLLGSDRDPAGGRVVTYHGWPLYGYLGDRKPGEAFGQALNANGGLWYVLSPAGAVIKAKWHPGAS